MTRDQTPIRAVLFDVDGTLYHASRLRRRMACALLLRFTFEPRRAAARVRNLQCWRRALETMRKEPAESIEEAGGLRARQRQLALQNGADAASLEGDVEEWMTERPLGPIRAARRRGMRELLEALRGSGIKLGVWSDYPYHDKLDALGLADAFDLGVSADDPAINCLKPWPRGFQHAARLWNLPTREILYVGDRPDVDATGANAAGMRCAIFGSGPAAGGYWAVKNPSELRDGLLAFVKGG